MYNTDAHGTVEEIDFIDPGIGTRKLFLTTVWNTRTVLDVVGVLLCLHTVQGGKH
jgi:hypothetical protein